MHIVNISVWITLVSFMLNNRFRFISLLYFVYYSYIMFLYLNEYSCVIFIRISFISTCFIFLNLRMLGRLSGFYLNTIYNMHNVCMFVVLVFTDNNCSVIRVRNYFVSLFVLSSLCLFVITYLI